MGVLVADPFDHGLVFLCALGLAAEDDEDDERRDPRARLDRRRRRRPRARRLAPRAGGGDARGALRDGRGGGARARMPPRSPRPPSARSRWPATARPELRSALEATREAALGGRASTTTACASRAPATSISWPTPRALSATSAPGAAAARRRALGRPQRRGARSGRAARARRLGRARPDRGCRCAGALQRRARRGRARPSRRSPRTCSRTTAPSSTTRRTAHDARSRDAPS